MSNEPVAPTRLNAAVPRDLETICLKCLEKVPARRYVSAATLADDLGRWRAGKPILARPIGPFGRLAKWAGRNPAVAVLAAALVVALSGGLAGMTRLYFQSERARALAADRADAEADARRAESAERRRAEDNFALARKAVEETLVAVAGHPRLREGDFHGVRRELLSKAIPFFREFVKQHSDDPDLEADRAAGLDRLAYLHEEMGETTEALAALAEARTVYARLADQAPTTLPYRQSLASVINSQGRLWANLGRTGDADAAFGDAMARHRELVAKQPDNAGFRNDLAISLHNRGMFWIHHGRQSEAEAPLREALSLRQQLADEVPDAFDRQYFVAISLDELGNFLNDTGRVRESEAAFREGLTILRRLTAAVPAEASYRRELGFLLNNLGDLIKRQGWRFGEVRMIYEEAIAVKKKLAADFPAVPGYRSELGNSWNNLGTTFWQARQFADAEPAVHEALATRQQLADAYPTMVDYALALGGTLCNLGHIRRDRGDPESALEWYGRAVQSLEGARARDPGSVNARVFLLNTYSGRAQTLARLGRHAEAAADWERLIALSSGPEQVSFRVSRSLALVRAGERGKAVAEAEALASMKDITASHVYDLACVMSLAAAAAGDAAEADRHAGQAVQLLRRAIDMGWKNVEHIPTDPDLERLRPREDYQRLLAEVKAKHPGGN